MRGDRVGVGDIGAMPCGARGSGDASCGDDGRGAARQRDHSIFNGHWKCERDGGTQQGEQRDYISDGTRGWVLCCGFDGDGAVRGDGMRGDRVGVGDICSMSCWARDSGHASCGDDGRGEGREWYFGTFD